MSNEVLVEKLFNSLSDQHDQSWYSKTHPFEFVLFFTGWQWWCNDHSLAQKLDHAGLQNEGFKTRIAAVRYLDAILGTDIEQGGFWKQNQNTYVCEEHNFELCLENQKWIVFRTNYPKITTDKNHQPFATRKAALRCVVEEYPHYVGKFNLDW